MTPNPTPPTSPTGQAVVPQWVTRVALLLFGIAGGIAAAPAAGIDISFLPPVVPKACALIAFLAAFVGLAGPGARKAAPVVLLVLTLGLSSCAHAPTPLQVTGESLDAAAITFEATAAGMATAYQRHAVTLEQARAWNDFLPKFKASYHVACALWRTARATKDEPLERQAAAILSEMLGKLSTFAVLLAAPDGGAS